MPVVKLPINFGPNKDVEEIGLETSGAAQVDCIVDANGNVMRRNGLVEFCDLGTALPVDGIFWWDRANMALAVSDGNIYKLTDNVGTFSDITSATLQSGTRVSFAEWYDNGTSTPWVFMANGGKIIRASTTTTTDIDTIDADSPDTVSHVAVLNKYLLALESGTEKVWYSVVDDPDNWDSDWISSESRFDLAKALGVSNIEIYIPGSNSLEVWVDDGTTPLVRESQGYVQSGIVAPYSFTQCDGLWYWLDDERKVVRLEGRTTKVLSQTLNKYIQDFSVVTDAMGDYVSFNGKPFFLLSFPTEGKSLAYDIYNGLWSEFGYWNSITTSHDRFRGNCATFAKAWNLTLVGDRSNGKIYKLSSTNYQDNGDTMRSMIRTPHINHGYQGIKKQSRSLTFHVKRFQTGESYSDAQIAIKWRNDGKTSWNNERVITLGRSGETDFVKKIHIGGVYYSRQYEAAFTDNAPLVLRAIEEDFDFLKNPE